jgi:phosphate transport system protein
MRERFAAELLEIEEQLADGFEEIGWTLGAIVETILDPGSQDATRLVAAANVLRATSRQVDARLVAVAARQAPVAEDLRLVLSLIQVAQHAALIANQFELIGEQLYELDPDARDPQQTAGQLSLMTELAGRQVQHAVRAFVARDADSARELQREDDALDRINRQVFEASYALDGDHGERELAMRYVLIARSLERIGDNAVDIAEQAVFLVTAQLQQFTDASRPKPRRGQHVDDRQTRPIAGRRE